MFAMEKLRRLLRLSSPPSSKLEGNFNDWLGAECVIIVIDAKGRVFQIEGSPRISNAVIRRVNNGKTATMELLNRFRVEDYQPLDD